MIICAVKFITKYSRKQAGALPIHVDQNGKYLQRKNVLLHGHSLTKDEQH
jgi:hypothetical protein